MNTSMLGLSSSFLWKSVSIVHAYSVTQSCLSLCNPMDCSHQAPISIKSHLFPGNFLILPANHLSTLIKFDLSLNEHGAEWTGNLL